MGKLVNLANPIGSLAAAGAAFAALIVSRADGLAGYGVGATGVSILAAFLAGGSTLAYGSAGTSTRSAVRHIRHRVIAPSLVAGAVLIAAANSLALEGQFSATLMGGLMVVFTNLTELLNVDYYRSSRVAKHAVILGGTRLIAVPVALLTGYFPLAMCVSALATWGCLAAMRPPIDTPPWSGSFRGAYAGAVHGQLRFYTLLEICALRWPYIASSLFLPVLAADRLSKLITLSLTASGLVTTLYSVAMSRRSVEKGIGDSSAIERLAIVGVGIGAASVIIAAGWVTRVVQVEGDEFVLCLRLLFVAVAIRGFTRLAQFRDISRLNYSSAAAPLAVTVALVVAALLLLATAGPLTVVHVAAVVTLGEVGGLCAVVLARLWAKRQR